MRLLTVMGLVGCAPHLYTSGGEGQDGAWIAPTNQWPIERPPADLRGEGFAVGQVIPDVRLVDQHGDEVSLWQFYGRVVILDVSTMWCAPCQELATGTQATADAFSDRPFSYLTVLHENVESQPPTQEDTMLWAENFGIEGPVLADGDKLTADVVLQGQYPAVLLIGPGLVVEERVNPPTDEEIRVVVERALAGG